MAAGHSSLKTKFEQADPESVVFEEDIHGPAMDDNENELEKMSSSSSAGTMGSVEEEMDGVNEKK